jgi:penicillin G amidase
LTASKDRPILTSWPGRLVSHLTDVTALNLPRLLLRWFVGQRLPHTRGQLTVPGVRESLRIRRDKWGIAYIEAANDADAWFGLGFCHGQDRGFQMEVLARVVRGTLAQWVGIDALPIDRLSRRIGFHAAAQKQLSVLDSDVLEWIDAYARGVTNGATLGLPRKPHEFVLLGGQASTWTAVDTLAVVKLISFTLPSNWDVELARLKILTDDGPEALVALDPRYPAWLPATKPPGQAARVVIDRLVEDLSLFASVAQTGGGSNNWALSAQRTATGRPLLANDPHLDSRLPNHWYLAHVRTPEWAVAGASFVGGPGILSGHNGFAAWGLTAGLVDNTDLFWEQIGKDGRSVRGGDAFVPCELREEVIAIRNATPMTESVLVTPRGPIISPAFVDGEGYKQALSLRAVWLDPLPLRGLMCLHKVHSFEEFRHTLSVWPALSQNMVYADVTGTIGWQLFGQAPIRRKGFGTLPQPGWDKAAGWEADLVPFGQMPFTVNPAQGFVATANNQPTADDHSAPFLGVDWIDGYRIGTITRTLASRTDWDVPSAMALQMDQHTPPWDELREFIFAIPTDNPVTKRGLELLRGWDGNVTVDSVAASVYELFLSEILARVAKAKAPRSYPWVLGQGASLLMDHNFFCFRRTGHLVSMLRSQPPNWFKRSWPEEMADALATVIRDLETVHGSDARHWVWGRLRVLRMRHILGGRRFLHRIFNLGPVPCGGDSDTINQASVFPLTPTNDCKNIASLRVVIDVGAWQNCRFVLPGGQSGNPLSPHYGDLFSLWQRGKGVPIAWTPEEVRAAAVTTLELRR